MSTAKSISGSGSLEMSSDVVSKTTKDGSGPPLPDSNFADLGTSVSSSSDTPSKRHKPMDREDRIAYLEGEIKEKDATLMRRSEEIASVIKERAKLHRKKGVLSNNESRRLGVIEEEDLPDMKEEKARLVAEIAAHKADLSRLKNHMELIDTPVPAQGMYVDKS